jgi:hypothetical protein
MPMTRPQDSHVIEFTYEECHEMYIAATERLQHIKLQLATSQFPLALIGTYKRALDTLASCEAKFRRCLV